MSLGTMKTRSRGGWPDARRLVKNGNPTLAGRPCLSRTFSKDTVP
jgi:hypothetical protein